MTSLGLNALVAELSAIGLQKDHIDKITKLGGKQSDLHLNGIRDSYSLWVLFKMSESNDDFLVRLGLPLDHVWRNDFLRFVSTMEPIRSSDVDDTDLDRGDALAEVSAQFMKVAP